MALSRGSTAVNKISLGTTAVQKISLGTALVWQSAFTDDFNRANNTSLGSNWIESGDVAITSNQFTTASLTSSRRGAIWATPTSTWYQRVTFKAVNPGTAVGLGAILRSDLAMTQMIVISVASSGWNIGTLPGINGTFTSLGSYSGTIAANSTVIVEVTPSNVWRVFINGVMTGTPFVNTTYADSTHKYLGLFAQANGATASIVDDFIGQDCPDPFTVVSDDFTRASLGSAWTTRFGPLYLASNELSSVGLASSPISYGFHTATSPSADMAAEAKLLWKGRNPQHSSMSVGVRADPATSHSGVHYWRVVDKHGICMYSWDGTTFTAATGTTDFPTTTKSTDGAKIRIEAHGTNYIAFLDGVFQLQGTFTTAQVPLTNRYYAIHGEDDSAVSGGGEAPGALDEFRGYSIS